MCFFKNSVWKDPNKELPKPSRRFSKRYILIEYQDDKGATKVERGVYWHDQDDPKKDKVFRTMHRYDPLPWPVRWAYVKDLLKC